MGTATLRNETASEGKQERQMTNALLISYQGDRKENVHNYLTKLGAWWRLNEGTYLVVPDSSMTSDELSDILTKTTIQKGTDKLFVLSLQLDSRMKPSGWLLQNEWNWWKDWIK